MDKKYVGHSLKEKPSQQNPAQISYAAEPPSPWWPGVFLTSAHINKLMIITKEKKSHQTNMQQIEG